jgi:hypothetical protein
LPLFRECLLSVGDGVDSGLTLAYRTISQISGRTRTPREAEVLLDAIEAAESGAAQKAHGIENEFEEALPWTDGSVIDLNEGETLKLPPTPDQLSREEEEEEWRRAKEERDAKRFLR